MAYAAKTDVSEHVTQAEIKGLLMKAGASAYGTMDEPGRSMIAFQLNNRRIRFTVPLPNLNDPEIAFTPSKKIRNKAEAQSAYNQVIRSRWRALLLCIKAKIEAVEVGISSFDEEFLAHVVTPGGKTVMERIGYDIESLAPSGPLFLGN